MVADTRSDSEAQAIRDLRFVTATLQRIGLPAWLNLDLPGAQLKALVALYGSDGSSVSALARSLSVGEPAASQLVEQLVRRGYAERSPDPVDRRRVMVRLTPAGAGLATELFQGRERHVQQWLSALTGEDVDALARGVRALATAAAADTEIEGSG